MSGILYLVPTPIGNMEDITLRALRILREVDCIACEDTRRTGLLLYHYEIKGNLSSYHEHNKEKAGAELIALLAAGKDIALVSDAGMPVISDPGAELVHAAIEREMEVVALPGAVAGITALIASGLDAREFYFVGFIPRTKKKRTEELAKLQSITATLVLYEAPHRLAETLGAIYDAWGERRAVLARELTKKYETFYRGTLTELMTSEIVAEPRGEFVILVEGYTPTEHILTPTAWPAAVEAAMAAGESYKEACRSVAKMAGVSRRDVYTYCLNHVAKRRKENGKHE